MVPASTSIRPVVSTLPGQRGSGPNQRFASVIAPSTLTPYSGRSPTVSIDQVAKGVWYRSVAPTAPASATSQNAPAPDSARDSVATVAQGTPGRAGRSARRGLRVERVDMTDSAHC